VSTYVAGPALQYVVMTNSDVLRGIHVAAAAVLVLLLCGGALALAIFFGGHARLQAPDLRAYLERKEPALDSPAVIPGASQAG